MKKRRCKNEGKAYPNDGKCLLTGEYCVDDEIEPCVDYEELGGKHE